MSTDGVHYPYFLCLLFPGSEKITVGIAEKKVQASKSHSSAAGDKKMPTAIYENETLEFKPSSLIRG